MNFNEYQGLAQRTMSSLISRQGQESHALHGMVGEIGELHSIYQKVYQGHHAEESHMMKEVGDLLWFIAEYCTAKGWNMDDIAEMNIQKLRARYPDGFDEWHSLHRAKDDE